MGRSTSRFYAGEVALRAHSVAITTNLSFSEWAAVFGDAKMTTALLGHLTHRCQFADRKVFSKWLRHEP